VDGEDLDTPTFTRRGLRLSGSGRGVRT
jgi:hypothetical protein